MTTVFPMKADRDDEVLFRKYFGKDLSEYWEYLFGFDIVKFDTDFYPENREAEGKSLKDFVREGHGSDAVELIERLIA